VTVLNQATSKHLFCRSLCVLIEFSSGHYVITNKRILIKVGFIGRKSLEIFLNRIEGIDVNQSVTGRIFGFGTVTIGGIGGTKNSFVYIPKPLTFRNNVQQQMQATDS
jgi:uncharacterized membrane protein YdbT with pleckstrin-like domain